MDVEACPISSCLSGGPQIVGDTLVARPGATSAPSAAIWRDTGLVSGMPGSVDRP
jgi:hypothetical protein